ncbi:MAG: phenylalanine--tRNA ligase subunit beta [candidate division WOR-3 bacterium]
MIVNYNWLLDWVDIDTEPHKLPELLDNIGIEVEKFELIEGDAIFEINVTPNRGDLLSVIGLAREIAAINGKRLKKNIEYKPTFPEKEILKVKIESEEDCQRYIATPISDIKIGRSPSFISERLEKCGIRSLNNVVDITNYVLLETGQPLHAFDFDKIEKEIIVRRARNGEKIVTLEGEEKELSRENLIIADTKGPIALAGVMGGLYSGISEETKRILLESAFFKPSVIRETSRKLKISTESSYRFERTVDINMVEYAAYYATQLLEKYANGKIMGKIVDTNPKPKSQRKVMISFSNINKLLGMEIEEEKSIDILKNLGFKIGKKLEEKIEVFAPSYRNDIKIEEDIAEEIGRFVGYDKIPLKFKYLNYGPIWLENKEVIEMKNIMVHLGFWEAINIPFIEPIWSEKPEESVFLENPLWSNKNMLRNTLIPGLLENAKRNLNRGEEIVKIFEVGRTFRKESEEEKVAGIITGKIPKSWYEKEREVDFYDIKGVVEALLEEASIEEYSFEKCNNSLFIKERALSLKLNGTIVGNLGLINQKVCKEDVYGFEFDLKTLLSARKEILYKKAIPFPTIKRDISLIVEREMPFEKIQALLDHSTKEKVKIKLIDVYSNSKIGEDKKSITIRLEFYNPEKTLTEDEIKEDIELILKNLEKIGATLRK